MLYGRIRTVFFLVGIEKQRFCYRIGIVLNLPCISLSMETAMFFDSSSSDRLRLERGKWKLLYWRKLFQLITRN